MDRKLFTFVEIALIAGLILAVMYLGGMFDRPPRPTATPIIASRSDTPTPPRQVSQPSRTPSPTAPVLMQTAPPLTRPSGQIAFESTRDGNHEIYLMEADGSRQVNLTRHPADDYLLSWSPDGGRIAFFSTRTQWLELYLMDPDGANVVRLTDTKTTNTAYAAPVSWSPDGQLLLALRATPWSLNNGPQSLLVELIRTDGAGVAAGAGIEKAHVAQLSVSPDGTHIAAIMSDQYGDGLYLYTAKVGGASAFSFRRVADDCYTYTWSPWPNTLTCSGGGSIFEINVDGALLPRSFGESQAGAAFVESMAWSPDGSLLLVMYEIYQQGGRSRSLNLLSWDENGARSRPLLSTLDMTGPFSWAPDSQWAAFAYQDPVGTRNIGIFNIYNPLDGPRLTDSGDNFNPQWQP